MDNDNEVKVILPRNFFLTKTVKEIKCKPIVAWLANSNFFLLIQGCLKIQQQLGQKTNLLYAEVIAMFTTGLHLFGIKKKIEQVRIVELLFDNIFIA